MTANRGGDMKPYDLARGVRDFDLTGDLAGRAAEMWALISHAELDIARAFWRQYRVSVEITSPIDDDKVEALSQRVLPYLRSMFGAIDRTEWLSLANAYVDDAVDKGNLTVDPAVRQRGADRSGSRRPDG